MKPALRWGLYAASVLLFSEAASRAVLSMDRFSAPTDRSADEIWRFAWVKRRQAVEIFYSFDVYHPTRGWALEPGLRGADPYGPSSLSSNSRGLRGVMEFTPERVTGTERIVLLGDSFTFGEEVADAEVYAQRLRELLPQTEVLNFGVHGYGHDQMLLYFVEDAYRFQPDVVIVGFVRDDMVRNVRGFRDYAKPRARLEESDLHITNVPVPTPRQTLVAHRVGPRLFDVVRILGDEMAWWVGRRDREVVETTRALLDRIAVEAAQAGAVTVFAYLPHSEELTVPEHVLPEEKFFDDYCRSRAAFCVNLRPMMLERIAAGEQVKVPGHWHANGHRMVAEGLADFLRRRRLVGGEST